MNKAEWIQHLRKLHAESNSQNFDLGDHVLLGIATFGRTEAFDAAAEITGAKHTRTFFTRCAAMATLYKPSLRFPKLNFHTYEVLARFELSFLERFIPEVAESGRSCAQIYALACEQYGSDPRRRKKLGKVHTVKLPEKLFCALSARAPSPDKTHLLIVKVLTEWEQQQGAGKASVPDGPSVGNESHAAATQPEVPVVPEKRPTYEERRKNWNPQTKSYDEPAPVEKPALDERKYTCKHKLLFTACKPDAWVDGDVPAQFSKRKTAATKFKTRELADIAAREYQEDRGYAIESLRCEVCKCWHIVGKNFAPFKAAEIDLTKEQPEVRVTVQDALQQHAQA